MKRVLVVALGPQSEPLSEAFRDGGRLAAQEMVTFLEIALNVAAVEKALIPPAFALVWIFVDRSMLDSPAVHACQQRLSPLGPVMIAVHLPQDDPAWYQDAPQFKGGVILQSYSDNSFSLVATLIEGFAAKLALRRVENTLPYVG